MGARGKGRAYSLEISGYHGRSIFSNQKCVSGTLIRSDNQLIWYNYYRGCGSEEIPVSKYLERGQRAKAKGSL